MSRAIPNPEFWALLDDLIADSRIIIDRPKNSRHPADPKIIYPLDYGYLDDTKSPDGEGIDLWLGSDTERKLAAVLLCVDAVKRDSEIKLLIGCSEAEVYMIEAFYNGYDTTKALLIYREEQP